MKVIIAGATGFIGSEVLRKCLAVNKFTSVVVLSRRPLEDGLAKNNPKLKVVLMNDFANYTPEVLSELSGAVCCVWAQGAPRASPEVDRQVNFEYPLAAARAFASIGATSAKRFRFVYLSGILAVQDQQKKLWIAESSRHLRGQLEVELLNFAKQQPNRFDVYIARPGGVLKTSGVSPMAVLGLFMPTLRVDHLAVALAELASRGDDAVKVWESDPLSARGKGLLDSGEYC
eukprot:TRINITY_DN30766_c0_g1_i1.p1 TRINITY_DN30766_c0_g1~~TRINITY_DN30766_c0_g1_i1.p1  ORF type:complete len:231 (+),score=42.90 TRINITY_DN30766_c0_g1_i1:79-771(+)